MARGIHRLTQLQLKRASRRGLYADGGGLYLQITKHGSRSWIFRYRRGGRSRMMGLGSLSVVDLREARELALAARKELHAGIDPLATRAGARAVAVKTISFDGATAAFLDAHSAAWRNAKHVKQWRNTLATYASPILGRFPVRDIDTGLVMRVLTPIWQTKPETASRLRGRIEAILGWAAVHGYRAGDNPARWKDHLQRLLPAKGKLRAVRHYAALPYAELPAFLAELRQQASVAARCLEFLILTATRTSEVIKATAAEFDLAAKVWTIPAGPHEGRPRAPHPARRARHRTPRRATARPRRGRVPALTDGAAQANQEANAAREHHLPWLPLDLPGLGRRAHELSKPRRRTGARPHDRQRGGGRLSARRSLRQTAAAHG